MINFNECPVIYESLSSVNDKSYPIRSDNLISEIEITANLIRDKIEEIFKYTKLNHNTIHHIKSVILDHLTYMFQTDKISIDCLEFLSKNLDVKNNYNQVIISFNEQDNIKNLQPELENIRDNILDTLHIINNKLSKNDLWCQEISEEMTLPLDQIRSQLESAKTNINLILNSSQDK